MTEIQNTSLPVDERTLLRVLTWLHVAGIYWAYQRPMNGPSTPLR